MKLAIYGVGRLGSAVAYAVMREVRPEEIQLFDIDKMRVRGEMVDLQNAADMLKIPTRFTMKKSSSDIAVICAGRARKDPREDVFMQNMNTVKRIMSFVKSRRIIMMTNPTQELTLWASKAYPTKIIENTDIFVDNPRRSGDLTTILGCKGYTSWGPASSVGLFIRMRGWDKL